MLAFTLLIILSLLAVSSSSSGYCAVDGEVFNDVPMPRTWDEARAYCKSTYALDAQGDLVVDTTFGARRFLYLQASKGEVWIGGNARSGSWQWVNGHYIAHDHLSRWAPLEPTSKGGDQLCMVGNYDGTQWHEQSCLVAKNFACQYDVAAHGYEWVSGRFLKHFSRLRNFQDAHGACQAGNGTLVKVDTRAVFLWIRAKNSDDWASWVGASDKDTEGEWRWEDGDIVDLEYPDTFFNEGQPDGGEGEDCAAYSHGGWRLDDMDCNIPHPYVCEYRVRTC